MTNLFQRLVFAPLLTAAVAAAGPSTTNSCYRSEQFFYTGAHGTDPETVEVREPGLVFTIGRTRPGEVMLTPTQAITRIENIREPDRTGRGR